MNNILSSIPYSDTLLIVLFVVLSLLALVIAFGIAWPILVYVKKNLEDWKKESNSLKKLLIIAFLGTAFGIVLIAGIIDIIIVNLICATIVFRRLPSDGSDDEHIWWLQTFTKRIQGYLWEWDKNAGSFNWYQKLYMKVTVYFANKIDRTPHFDIPESLVKEMW